MNSKFGELKPLEAVSLFVLKNRRRGLTLSSRDLTILHGWLIAAGGDANRLLVVLADLLPDHFSQTKGLAAPLTLLDKRVRRRLGALEVRA